MNMGAKEQILKSYLHFIHKKNLSCEKLHMNSEEGKKFAWVVVAFWDRNQIPMS